MKIPTLFLKNNIEKIGLIVLLFLSAFTFAFNMFDYPYYENDEGTYMAQAWAVISQGKLAPYTYWYDHAPVGWFLISIWELLSGGYYAFGFSINSGRVLMLILHVLTAFLTYSITKKVSGSKLAGVIALLIFSLSPLGLSFQRRVLLDNIMIFWFLFSYNLILGSGRKLYHYILSAVFYAVAVLSKESAIFFLPVMVFMIYWTSHLSHRAFALWKWLSISGGIISLYFVYALLKGEFFPYGSFLGNESPHVSLIETLQFQLSRKGGFFLDANSGFMLNFTEWINGGFFIPVPDPTIIIGGIVATIIVSLWSVFDRRLLAISLPTLFYWFFLIRGGEVIGFYIVPLIPFLAMCIGISIFKISDIFPMGVIRSLLRPILIVALSSPFIGYYLTHPEVYYLNQTKPQIEALEWISKNIPKESVLVIDNYAFIEFYESRNNKYDLPKIAHYYWKADKDPDVRDEILDGDWRNIDYILSTPQVKWDAENSGLPLIQDAMNNSTVIKSFEGNKWNIEIRQISNINDLLLDNTWATYKNSFITHDGKVTDPGNNITTSEGQSYALLRSVWANDQQTFSKVLSWTLIHLQSKDNSLFAWKYGKDETGKEKVLDSGAATDADQDVALALLLASKQWDKDEYRILAKDIISDIWKYETVEIKGKRYIVAGDWASDKKNTQFTINPSYLSPYAYRIFAEVDKKHDWMSVVNTSYEVLEKCSSSPLGVPNAEYLPPDWCNIIRNGAIVEAKNISRNSTNYSYDAVRVPWRIGLDYLWNKEERAIEYLGKIKLFKSEWEKSDKIYSSYAHSGKAVDDTESLSQYAGQLAYFTILDKQIADSIYDSKILPSLKNRNMKYYWGNINNYYDQNWVWFSTAFYKNRLPNLWEHNDLE